MASRPLPSSAAATTSAPNGRMVMSGFQIDARGAAINGASLRSARRNAPSDSKTTPRHAAERDRRTSVPASHDSAAALIDRAINDRLSAERPASA
jgi:hypothetical protein